MSTGSTGSLSQTVASAHILATVAPRSTPDISPSTSSQPMMLLSTLPPIATKLVAKIQSGQFVAMKELLADNMSLCQQVEAWPTQHVFTGAAKPRLRDVDSPLNWVSCFLAYAAVRTPDPGTRKLLTYGRPADTRGQRQLCMASQRPPPPPPSQSCGHNLGWSHPMVAPNAWVDPLGP